MRVFMVIALLAGVLVSGCLSEGADPGPQPGPGADNGASQEEQDQEELLEAHLKDHPEFCASEDDSGHFLVDGCRFWDLYYHETFVYDVDTTVFDVVIVPPVGMTTPDQIETSRMALQAWRDGIMEFAAPWFVDEFEMNIYAVGIDIPSLDAVQDPEIVVVSSSAAFIFGIGLEPKQLSCAILGEETVRELGGHFHGPHQILAEDCTGIGFTCFALNVGDIDAYELYDLIAHEVGHCLGIGHVGDALDFRSRYAPVEDIMSYQSNPEQVHCVSNLNVETLEAVFARLLDREEQERVADESYHHMSPLDYRQVECENPPSLT